VSPFTIFKSKSKNFYRLRRFKRGLISLLVRRWRIFLPLLRAEASVKLRHYASANHLRELLIFLPGIGDVLEDYELRGFIDTARQNAVPFVTPSVNKIRYLAAPFLLF
jgi:hypothetical protein